MVHGIQGWRECHRARCHRGLGGARGGACRARFQLGARGAGFDASTALLYDVHGNLPALEAVLDDARAAGADASSWAATTRCSEPIRPRPSPGCESCADAMWIRGNVDRWCAHPGTRRRRTSCSRVRSPLAVRRSVEHEWTSWALSVRGLPNGCRLLPWLADLRHPVLRARARGRTTSCSLLANSVSSSGTRISRSAARPAGIQLSIPAASGLPLDGDHRSSYALLTTESFELVESPTTTRLRRGPCSGLARPRGPRRSPQAQHRAGDPG